MITLDANGMVLSPSMVVRLHVLLQREHITPDSVAINEDLEKSNTLSGIPLHKDETLPLGVVALKKGKDIVGEIRNLQVPVILSFWNQHGIVIEPGRS